MASDGQHVGWLRHRARSLGTGLIVVIVLTAGFFTEQRITGDAFDTLEANQVAQDAQRLRIALEYEARLLTSFGATNSIWDNTYTDLENADRSTFTADFAPTELYNTQSIDGVLGVGPDGTLRTGGLTAGAADYATAPVDLSQPSVLGELFDNKGAAGQGRCGVIASSAAPFLYCGFAVYHSDSSGPPAGGLIVLKALDPQRLDALSKKIDLSMTLVTTATGHGSWRKMHGELGDMEVTTAVRSENKMALTARIPTIGGGAILLECARDRPIRRAASGVAVQMFGLVAVIGLFLLYMTVLMIKRGVRSQVQPLRMTTEKIVASGDRNLRIGGGSRHSDIGALASTIDSMLDVLAAQDAQIQLEQEAREQRFRTANARQRLAEQQVRRRAQALVDETSAVVIGELQDVVNQVEAVRNATGTIGRRVRAADEVTTDVVARARRADHVVGALAESLRQVGGVANVIGAIAAKTNLLALNATIEAVRAGEAGRSFTIVAREVKELATATARSTQEISTTIESLERDAASITEAITGMADGIGGIDDATSAVSAVADQQHAMVTHLDQSVKDTIGRIESMAHLADRLDRRASARVAVTGNVTMLLAGQTYVAQLLDISESGMRCQIDPDVPFSEGQQAEITVPIDGDPVRLVGLGVRRVVNEDDKTIEMGLRFSEPTANISAQLREYVAAFISDTERPVSV